MGGEVGTVSKYEFRGGREGRVHLPETVHSGLKVGLRTSFLTRCVQGACRGWVGTELER